MKNIHSILVWGPNWIGDIILGLPTVMALKERYPGSRLTFVVRAPFDDILKEADYIDNLVTHDPSGAHRGLLGKFFLIKSLRAHRFDLAIALPNSFRAGVMLFLSGAKRRAGYASDGRGFLLTDRAPRRSRKNEGHRVDYFFRIASMLGCEKPAHDPRIEISGQGEKDARELLEKKGVKDGDILIGLHPGASKPPRTLAPRTFSKICGAIQRKWDAKILLLGSEREKELVREVLSGADSEGVFIINAPIPLGATASLLKRCDYFIGCDSGLMHLAAAVGTPVIGLFGPGVPEHTGPACAEEKKAIIFHRFPCAPCRQRFFMDCEPSQDGRPPCIEKIRVEEVIGGLEKLIDKHA